jgi:amino acid adenylation domain-containing protein
MTFLLSQIIESSAGRNPDKVALRLDGQSLSYAELVRRSDKLAWLLQADGVKKLDRVGVYLNKSMETVVAIYGIMRAGAVYVPLDPRSPLSRLQFMVQDCGIRHLISHAPQLSAVRELLANERHLTHIYGIKDVEIEGITSVAWEVINGLPDSTPRDPGCMEHDLAYIMYTSGSTGNPKGLMHTHASGLSYARMSACTYDVKAEDVLSNHSPLHFDMSTFDYFTSLMAGATTVIIPEAFTKLPASLSQLIQSERMTIWYSVPFALIQLLLRGVLPSRRLDSLRWVLFGGEPFPPKYLKALMELWPHARFSNVYGPAEVNQCTYYHVPPLHTDEESVPIGKIWENASGLILGENDREALGAEIGELVVRTPTMMRGYWNRPDLNERAFFRRQIFDNYEEIYYRTGDLVQRMSTGDMKFLGRKDRQVKTRGHRVELDEVENIIGGLPQVEEAAVFAVPNAEGSQEIEAAVILKSGVTLLEKDLKKQLSNLLSWYAFPQRIFILEEFPRTGSGKIDRRRLGAQVQSALESQERHAD